MPLSLTLSKMPERTSNGTEIKNLYLGPISMVMRLLTHKDGDLSAHFDENNET